MFIDCQRAKRCRDDAEKIIMRRHHPHRRRQRHCSRHGSHRHDARQRQRHDENHQRNQQRPRRERQINARRRRDAFAAFELQPAGVVVSPARRKRRQGQKTSFGFQWGCHQNIGTALNNAARAGCPNYRRKEFNGDKAFQQNGSPTQKFPPVCPAPRMAFVAPNVAAAHRTGVNPLRLRDEIAERNRAEQIRAERRPGVS